MELEKKQLDVDKFDIRYGSLSVWDGIRCSILRSIRPSGSSVCRVDGSEQLACIYNSNFDIVRTMASLIAVWRICLPFRGMPLTPSSLRGSTANRFQSSKE